MRSRSAYAMGVSIVWFAACGGEPFSSEGAGGEAGSAGAGGKSTNTGGSSAKAGGSGKAGTGSGQAGSGSSSGGAAGVGGNLGTAGVLGVSGSMTGEAGAPSCDEPSMCPTSSACVEATCSSGECGEKNLPDGPFEQQMPGDCEQARCQGGKEVFVADLMDKDDRNPCTKDECGANGAALHVAQTGQACGDGGLCSPEGKCEMCPDLCPVPVDPCQVAYCKAGMCQVGPAPIDKLCPLMSSAGDTYGQCDGQGHCVDCTNSGGCDEASVCSAERQCVPD